MSLISWARAATVWLLLLVSVECAWPQRIARFRCGYKQRLKPTVIDLGPPQSTLDCDDCFDDGDYKDYDYYFDDPATICSNEMQYSTENNIQSKSSICFPDYYQQSKKFFSPSNFWDPQLNYQLHQISTQYSPNRVKGFATSGARRLSSSLTDPCDRLYLSGENMDGFFLVRIAGRVAKIYCEFNKHGNYNWLVFQQRIDGEVDFYRNWAQYEFGFGSNEEFWLGLKNLHELTRFETYVLRVNIQDSDGRSAYAEYSDFKIGKRLFKYQLFIGSYQGTAGDSMRYHNGAPFSTRDRNSDTHYRNRNCAVECEGAWWYQSCYYSNLNGKYLPPGTVDIRGIVWYDWKRNLRSLERVSMKIRLNRE